MSSNSESSSPSPHEDPTLPPRQDLVSGTGADEFATVTPENNAPDATVVPPVDSDATILPIRETQSQGTAGARVHYFGDYELLSEIARGGMGVVYKARQVNLNRIVALKMILAGQLASEEDVQRFRTEAEAAANLDHPGIVPIYEIGQHEGQHFFSMGYVDGCSLADRVRNGPLPPKDAADLTKKIAEAIAFAHSRNVIHRDLKPANVLLDQNGEPKVTDFGLARKTDTDSGMTRTGAVMGTPSYMPPEQAAGKTSEVGPLSDVYSLGAMLYCLLTGRPPFQAANPIDTLMQVIEREPLALTVLNPLVPRDLETISLKCLQKDPAKRYESALELVADLERWQKGEPIKARAVSRTERVYRWIKRNKIVSGLLAATAVGLVSSIVIGIFLRIETEKAKLAEMDAKKSETSAVASRDQTEATLARSSLFLAHARWDENRVGDALELLQRIPTKHRHLEWYLSRRQFEGSAMTIFQHGSSIRSVCFSPDGARIASGGGHEIKLWDSATGAELVKIEGVVGMVNDVRFSPDGLQIAAATGILEQPGEVKLWDVASGAELISIKGNGQPVGSVCFSPDGRHIVATGGILNQQGEIHVWDVATGDELFAIETGHSSAFTSVCFAPNGEYFASAGLDKLVKLWDATTGAEIAILQGHQGPVTSVSFSPDGNYLVSATGIADQPGEIKLWDLTTKAESVSFKGHSGPVTSVCFSPDARQIASSSGGLNSRPEIKLWDATTGAEIITFKGHRESVSSVSFSPDGARLVSGSSDHTIRLWPVAEEPKRTTLAGKKIPLNTVSFSPDGMRIASAGWDQNVRISDAFTGDVLSTLESGPGIGNCVSFNPDGSLIALGQGDGAVRIWHASTGRDVLTLGGQSQPVNSICFSPDGTRITAGTGTYGAAGEVKLWSVRSGEEIATLKGHEESVSSVSFSPDGTRIASGSSERTIKIWDASTGAELTTLKGHRGQVNSVSFSPTGDRIVSGSQDDTIKLWDMATGINISTLKGHGEAVHSVSFSPAGDRVISASQDKTIKLWDAATGEELLTFKGHLKSVTCVNFCVDGSQIASADSGGVIKLWDAAKVPAVTTYAGHDQDVFEVILNLEGTRMLSRSLDRELLYWDLQTGKVSHEGNAAEFPARENSNQSLDHRWLAIPHENDVLLVDLACESTPEARRRRALLARPRASWHREQALAAQSAARWYTATFHFAWLLKITPNDAWLFDDLHETYQRLLVSRSDQPDSLPLVISEMLKLPRGVELPQLNEESAVAVNQQVWELVKSPVAEGSSTVSNWHLQRMQDVCTGFSMGVYFHTLGVLQYRMGQFAPAIASLQKSLELSPSELGDSGPLPEDLAFLTLCQHKLGNVETAIDYRSQMLNAASQQPESILDPDLQAILLEVQSTLDGPESIAPAASLSDFQREGTFEGLVQHRWRLPDTRRWVKSFAVSSDDPHSGKTCLQAKGIYGLVTAQQTVAVVPNSKYRLTGWIRTQLEVPAAVEPQLAAEASGSEPQNAAEAPVSPTEEVTVSSTPIVGACFAILGREEASEIVTGTTQWTQVTWEFATGDETTTTIGCRLGMPDQVCNGTAYFDDLKLEKVE